MWALSPNPPNQYSVWWCRSEWSSRQEKTLKKRNNILLNLKQGLLSLKQ